MGIKFVIIIQCDIARLRCSGFACTKCFYDREGFFKDCGYPHGTRYIAFTCGGCCGGSNTSPPAWSPTTTTTTAARTLNISRG